MRICWDNLEKLRFTKNGNFVVKHNKYFYKECCVVCEEPFLYQQGKETDYCSHKCYRTERKHKPETIVKLSKTKKGKNNPMYGTKGKLCPSYGKSKSEEHKHKISESKKGCKISEECKRKLSEANSGSGNSQWLGGVKKRNLPLYSTYAHQISFAEKVRPFINIDGLVLLQVRCAYCGKWYVPGARAVKSRVAALEGKPKAGEARLYCSKDCKTNCPIFGRQLYPKGFKEGTSREVDPYIRQLCFERDNWQCQKCFSESNLHCHHIKSYRLNKLIANDIDNCITLCKGCHKVIHKELGCRYVDLRCDKQ